MRGWGLVYVLNPSYPLHHPGWPKGRRGETEGDQGNPSARELLRVLFGRKGLCLCSCKSYLRMSMCTNVRTYV